MPSRESRDVSGPSYGLGELARAAGLPLATVKYYLREGLLPEGRRRSATRADYGDAHLVRLRLLRILREVGDVPVGRLRDLVAALDEGSGGSEVDVADEPGAAIEASAFGVLGAGAAALVGPPPEPGPLAEPAALLAAELVQQAGWDQVRDESPHRAQLRAVLEAVLTWEADGPPTAASDLSTYVEAADLVARHDVDSLDADDPQSLLAQLVVGQVVYGRLLSVLRLLGEEHHAARRYGG